MHVGDNCTDGDAVNSLNKADDLTAAQIPGYSLTDPITPAVALRVGGGERVLHRRHVVFG